MSTLVVGLCVPAPLLLGICRPLLCSFGAVSLTMPLCFSNPFDHSILTFLQATLESVLKYHVVLTVRRIPSGFTSGKPVATLQGQDIIVTDKE